MNEINISTSLETRLSEVKNIKFANYIAFLRQKYSLNNKVLLIQVPQFILDSFNIKVAKAKGCYAYPPIGLQCIAKTLATRNLEIDILDLNYQLLKRVINDDSFNHLDWLDILDEYLKRNSPSIIGVTCISVYSEVFKDNHPLTCLFRYLQKKDKFIVIAGGTTATNEYENYLSQGLCHFVIEGEGENKINFLFDYLLEDKQSNVPTPGIYFKFDNSIEESEGKKDTVLLKGDLIDTYKYVPIEDYHNVGSLNPFSRMAGQDRKFTGIQLNRGCRANCKFCGVIEFMGKGLRQYPVKDLIKEIHYLIKEKGIMHFELLDDDFLVSQSCNDAAVALLEEMAKLNKKYGISWAAGNGLIAASLNESMLNLMRDSGCVGFRIGIESGNEQMLRRMHKPTSLPLLKKVGLMLQKFPELFVGGNYIIGFFGEETFVEMLDTLRLSCEINLDWASFSAFQFTSRTNISKENLKLKREVATNFIPARDNSNREIIETEEIVSGHEVFKIAKETIPSLEQIKQIWFVFNLVANYINNKNLRPDGKPEKFISWVEAVRVVYPDNPYMYLFLGIGYVLLGNKDLAKMNLERVKKILKASRYWDNRFAQFELHKLIVDFPQNAQKMQEALESMRQKYSEWTGRSFRRVLDNERI